MLNNRLIFINNLDEKIHRLFYYSLLKLGSNENKISVNDAIHQKNVLNAGVDGILLKMIWIILVEFIALLK